MSTQPSQLDRITVRGVRWLLVLSVLAVLGLIVTAVVRHYSQWFPFQQLAVRLQRCSERLQAARPEGNAEERWQGAVIATDHAWTNVCYSPDHVDVAAMRGFVEALEQKLHSGQIDVETLYWVWDTLETIEPTGQYGRTYVERFKPDFVEGLGPDAIHGR